MILKQKEVKTRKPHKCWGCNRTIPKGTRCMTEAWTDYGEFVHGHFCFDCTWAREQLDDGEEFYQGQLFEFLLENKVIQRGNRQEYKQGRLYDEAKEQQRLQVLQSRILYASQQRRADHRKPDDPAGSSQSPGRVD